MSVRTKPRPEKQLQTRERENTENGKRKREARKRAFSRGSERTRKRRGKIASFLRSVKDGCPNARSTSKQSFLPRNRTRSTITSRFLDWLLLVCPPPSLPPLPLYPRCHLLSLPHSSRTVARKLTTYMSTISFSFFLLPFPFHLSCSYIASSPAVAYPCTPLYAFFHSLLSGRVSPSSSFYQLVKDTAPSRIGRDCIGL